MIDIHIRVWDRHPDRASLFTDLQYLVGDLWRAVRYRGQVMKGTQCLRWSFRQAWGNFRNARECPFGWCPKCERGLRVFDGNARDFTEEIVCSDCESGQETDPYPERVWPSAENN